MEYIVMMGMFFGSLLIAFIGSTILENNDNQKTVKRNNTSRTFQKVIEIQKQKPFKNPIIGKWRSEQSIPFMGKLSMEVEYTADREYIGGMSSKVNYEMNGNKVIVTDDTGIGVTFEMINHDTMKTNLFGITNIYRRI